MSDTGFPMENKPKKRKIPLSWVWVASLALLSAVFAFASVPGVIAQVRDGAAVAAGQREAENIQRNRRYAEIIRQVMDFIQRNYVEEVDSQVIFEGAMTGIFEALGDPYSAFLPESEMRGLNDTTQGVFGGVGLFISQPRRTGPNYVEVSSPIEGTPGWRAGINPGDLIISIDGEPTDRLTMDEVLGRLRGHPGTDVNLMIRRGERLGFPVTLTRAIIEVPTARHAMIGDIGYLRLTSFTPMTANRAAEAIAYFRSNNYQGMILDLRDNFGGLLNAAIDVASLFLDGGVVVRTRSRIPAENQTFSTRRPAVVPHDIPIIVLINRGSASASEIVAGALKDRGRAFLVGETTFGKGSVQQVYPLLGNVGFRLTTARYVTPNNAVIDGIGIPPDRMVRLPDFAAADAADLNRLINDDLISVFVRDNPNATVAQRDAFARSLATQYSLDVALIRRLIRNAQNRTAAPVFDLEYDIQLQEAVNILRGGDFQYLLQTAQTLQALQEELLRLREEEEAAAS